MPMTKSEFLALAQAYQEKHNCRWSEACRQIKKKYPEALVCFGGPDRREQSTPGAS